MKVNDKNRRIFFDLLNLSDNNVTANDVEPRIVFHGITAATTAPAATTTTRVPPSFLRTSSSIRFPDDHSEQGSLENVLGVKLEQKMKGWVGFMKPDLDKIVREGKKLEVRRLRPRSMDRKSNVLVLTFQQYFNL